MSNVKRRQQSVSLGEHRILSFSASFVRQVVRGIGESCVFLQVCRTRRISSRSSRKKSMRAYRPIRSVPAVKPKHRINFFSQLPSSSNLLHFRFVQQKKISEFSNVKNTIISQRRCICVRHVITNLRYLLIFCEQINSKRYSFIILCVLVL